MSNVSSKFGLPCPVPAHHSQIIREAWVYRLALQARADLSRTPAIGAMLHPLAAVAAATAGRWIEGGPEEVTDPYARQWLMATSGDIHAATWLAAAIVEILTLDETTQAWLRSHRLPSRSMRKGGK